MDNENTNWLHDLFIKEAKAAKDYHNNGGGGVEYDGAIDIVDDGGEASAYLQEKIIDVTANGTVEVTPDEGHALSKVTANVDVVSAEEWINDGNTHIWISLPEGRISPILGFGVYGTVSVDWGDGTIPDVLTGTGATTLQYTPTHDYASAGDYVITLTVDGEMGFCASGLLLHPSKNSNSYVYKSAIQKVECGNAVRIINDKAFDSCYNLTSINIPEGVTSLGNYAFQNCYSLASINIPDSVTRMGVSVFTNCYSLASVNAQGGLTSIGNSAFQRCYSLATVNMQEGVTSLGNNMFDSCYNLTNIVIPEGVTSLGNNVFMDCKSLTSINIPNGVASIGTNAFANCYSLVSINIPDSVTSIGNTAFYMCYGLAKIRFEGAIPPSVGGSSAFTYLPTDCIISIPVGSLEAYTTATNYPSASTYTYVEE